jgi:UDP-N-acetylglucosamine acyltransferase
VIRGEGMKMPEIAPTASIDPACRLPADVEIGPGCVIGPNVVLGSDCRLMANVVVMGCTTIGNGNVFYPNCVIGAPPQDLKYRGEKTRLIIGDHNIFRECVTIHTGTALGGGQTVIGDHNQFQVGSHIAHDVRVGNHCILSNAVQIAGHVQIDDHVTISGLVGVHQFVTLGKYSFVVGLARCTTDVPPFIIYGHDGAIIGINVRGLSRWGFTEEQTDRLKILYRQLFPRRSRPTDNGRIRNIYKMIFSRKARRAAMSMSRRIAEAEANGDLDEHGRYLIEFLKRSMKDGVYGRYLEAKREDAGTPPPEFYSAASAAMPEVPA